MTKASYHCIVYRAAGLRCAWWRIHTLVCEENLATTLACMTPRTQRWHELSKLKVNMIGDGAPNDDDGDLGVARRLHALIFLFCARHRSCRPISHRHTLAETLFVNLIGVEPIFASSNSSLSIHASRSPVHMVTIRHGWLPHPGASRSLSTRDCCSLFSRRIWASLPVTAPSRRICSCPPLRNVAP